jgi:hypothetical protein
MNTSFVSVLQSTSTSNQFAQIAKAVSDANIDLGTLITYGHSDLGSIRGIGPKLQMVVQNAQGFYREAQRNERAKQEAGDKQELVEAKASALTFEAVVKEYHDGKMMDMEVCDCPNCVAKQTALVVVVPVQGENAMIPPTPPLVSVTSGVTEEYKGILVVKHLPTGKCYVFGNNNNFYEGANRAVPIGSRKEMKGAALRSYNVLSLQNKNREDWVMLGTTAIFINGKCTKTHGKPWFKAQWVEGKFVSTFV